MKKATDFLKEIDNIVASCIPNVDFEKDYESILKAEALYQVSKLIDSGIYSEEEISKIIKAGIFKIEETIKDLKENNFSSGYFIHPYRYLPIKAPIMLRDKYGNVSWKIPENKKTPKDSFSLIDVLQYAYNNLKVIKSDRDMGIIQWLLQEVEKFQRQQRTIIAKADRIDLLLFAIDATSVDDRASDLFAISNNLRAGAELYMDKANLLKHNDTN